MGALGEKDEATKGERVRLDQLTQLQRTKGIVAQKPKGFNPNQLAPLPMKQLAECYIEWSHQPRHDRKKRNSR